MIFGEVFNRSVEVGQSGDSAIDTINLSIEDRVKLFCCLGFARRNQKSFSPECRNRIALLSTLQLGIGLNYEPYLRAKKTSVKGSKLPRTQQPMSTSRPMDKDTMRQARLVRRLRRLSINL